MNNLRKIDNISKKEDIEGIPKYVWQINDIYGFLERLSVVSIECMGENTLHIFDREDFHYCFKKGDTLWILYKEPGTFLFTKIKEYLDSGLTLEQVFFTLSI